MLSCASQSSLGGGAKDETPPVLLKCSPENNTVNFTGKKISMQFDEFIVLKSVQQKLIISPPMAVKPDVTGKTKSVEVTFNDSLLPNTTYTINFADAITDLNEGNAINDFRLCFSTGPFLDSLKVTGNISDAYTLKPENGMLVMLYTDTTDSAPFKKIPFYVARTDNNGSFVINNIREGLYRLFALNDMNGNLMFDMPGEKIAYLDTLIIPEAVLVTVSDTLKKGSVYKTDTLLNDTTITRTVTEFSPKNLSLRSFEEDRKKQFIKTTSRPFRFKCMVLFNRAASGEVTVESANIKHFITEQSISSDTLVIWIADTTELLADTAIFSMNYFKKDSADNIYPYSEDVKFVFREPSKKAQIRKNLSAVFNITNNQQIPFNSTIRLFFSAPVDSVLPGCLILEELHDTVYVKVNPKIKKSGKSPCVYYISYDWKHNNKYRLSAEKGKISDIYNRQSDSLLRSFSVYPEDYYSSVNFIITGNASDLLFQLTDASGKIYREWAGGLQANNKFDFLMPGKYKLKAIADTNKNNKWDTGFYLHNKEPEKVYYYPEEINLRSNWEIEIKWDIKEK